MALAAKEYYESLPRRRMAAGILLLDSSGSILIVEPTYKEHWEIPGGSSEEGEDPRQTCQRECLEELGLSLGIGRVLVLEHQSHAAPMGDSIMFVYDGGVVPANATIQLPQDELRSYRFVPESELAQL